MIDIRFVKGREVGAAYPTPPKFIDEYGLTTRLAIIQGTYLEGCPDMYFDPSLLDYLIAYMKQYRPTASIGVVENEWKNIKHEIPLDTFMMTWSAVSDEEKEPPAVILCRNLHLVELCVITEYWTAVGGPSPYADSYTYSVFSKEDLSNRIPIFLTECPPSSRWRIDPNVLSADGS